MRQNLKSVEPLKLTPLLEELIESSTSLGERNELIAFAAGITAAEEVFESLFWCGLRFVLEEEI